MRADYVLVQFARDNPAAFTAGITLTLAFSGAVFVYVSLRADGEAGLLRWVDDVSARLTVKLLQQVAKKGHALYRLEATRGRSSVPAPSLDDEVSAAATEWLRAVSDWLRNERQRVSLRARVSASGYSLVVYSLLGLGALFLDYAKLAPDWRAYLVLGWATAFACFTLVSSPLFVLAYRHGAPGKKHES